MLEKYNDVININDICDILHISKKTAYKLLKKGEMPYKKIGRIYRIRKTAMIEFLNK